MSGGDATARGVGVRGYRVSARLPSISSFLLAVIWGNFVCPNSGGKKNMKSISSMKQKLEKNT